MSVSPGAYWASWGLTGRAHWIIETVSQPVSSIMGSKVVANLLVAGVPAIVAGSTAAAGLGARGAVAVPFALAAVAAAAFASCFGALANGRMHNYIWASEYEVVKRSLPMMLTLVVGVAFRLAGLVVSEGVLAALGDGAACVASATVGVASAGCSLMAAWAACRISLKE